MTDTQTVAVIGAGYWGKNHVRNFAELGALGSVCDASDAVRESLAAQYPDCRIVSSVGDVLSDDAIEAVSIASPAETHAELVERFLQAGKDVLVEKPLCLKAADGDRLVALARDEGRILMVGHLLWYHPAVLKLKELVDAGELGNIRYIYSNRLNLGKIRREENILWSFAPHDISVVLGLVGEMPSSVESRGGNYLDKDIADVTVSLLSFPSGVKAHIFVSWLHPYKEQKMGVVGSEKMAVFDDVVGEDKLIVYPHSVDLDGQVPVVNKAAAEPVRIQMAEPLRAECSHFLECVQTRCTPRTDGEEGLRVLRVLEKCQAGL